MQRMWNKIPYNLGTEPTLNHAICIVSNLNCFRLMFFRKTLLPNIWKCFCERLRVKRARFLRLLNVLLNRAAVGWAVSCSAFGLFFFRFVGNYIQTSADDVPLGQLSSPDDVIISQLWAISQLFSSYPPSRAFCQVSKLTIQTEHDRLWEMFIWSKLGQNPSDIHVGTFARIKNLIWDQSQATKAEIIQS